MPGTGGALWAAGHRLARVETSKQGRLKRKSYASEYLTEFNGPRIIASPPWIDRGAAAPSRGLKLQVNHSSAAIMLHHAICVYLCVEHHHEYLTSAD